MAKDIDKMIEALSAKQIPVATLDNKWHKLFMRVEKSNDIYELENELNTLLRKQGKINNDIKSIKALKKKLMDEIVTLMEDSDSSSKVEENKRLIEECNEKIDSYGDELMELPKAIADVNKQLMIRTMDVCYDVLHDNEKDIDELDEWLTKLRIELKKKVVRKQEMELANQEIYSYMHDIFGVAVINLFDMKYNPEDNQLKKASDKE